MKSHIRHLKIGDMLTSSTISGEIIISVVLTIHLIDRSVVINALHDGKITRYNFDDDASLLWLETRLNRE